MIKSFEKWADPLLRSFAFLRLTGVTFLGILSPRFSFLPRFPFKTHVDYQMLDGTRADHSIAVARLALEICKAMKLSEQAQKYSVAWALLHDVATWPLSHTGEAAFVKTTNLDSHLLRELIIRGSTKLPDYFGVPDVLRKLRIDTDILLSLFDKSTNAGTRDLSVLWQILNSPMTPDTIEGMYRSGQVFGITVPNPEEIAQQFVSDLFSDAHINRDGSGLVLRFWRSKSQIYRKYINSKKSIRFESEWALRIERAFSNCGLVESLLLPEIGILAVAGTIKLDRYEQRRYKPPLDYFVAAPYARKRNIGHDLRISELSDFLSKVRKNVN